MSKSAAAAPLPPARPLSPPNAPLKVLYVSPHAAMGGAERVTLDLLALHDRAAVERSVDQGCEREVTWLPEFHLVDHRSMNDM